MTRPRRSQADRSAATRAKVLAAARDVLCSQGYSGATMFAIRDAAGIGNDEAYQTLQLLNNAVTRGLTVEYIRNPDMALIERSVAIWKRQMLELVFGPDEAGGS